MCLPGLVICSYDLVLLKVAHLFIHTHADSPQARRGVRGSSPRIKSLFMNLYL